jgi:hypothetical protein
MKIYISGKISGIPLHKASAKFWLAAKQAETLYLAEPTVHVINPINIKPLLGIKKYWCYMAADLWKLIWCDAAYFMASWKQSRGARIERKICEFLKIPIHDEFDTGEYSDFIQEMEIFNTWLKLKSHLGLTNT